MAAAAKRVEMADEGRLARRRRMTRARLIEAAFDIISEVGVDAAKIKDVTDRADVGFGTFYNYFASKDELASQTLDCVIDDFGRRNILATKALRETDPALVLPFSTRLVMREAARAPMWQWWALRPDLLVDRMRDGFGHFAKRDMRDAIRRGVFTIAESEIDQAWALACWIMVGGIHDIVVGDRPLESEVFVVQAIVRLMGASAEAVQRVSDTPLPKYSKPKIDWQFELPKAG